MRRLCDLTARAFTAVKDRSRNEKNDSGNNQEDEGANDSYDENPGVEDSSEGDDGGLIIALVSRGNDGIPCIVGTQASMKRGGWRSGCQ